MPDLSFSQLRRLRIAKQTLICLLAVPFSNQTAAVTPFSNHRHSTNLVVDLVSTRWQPSQANGGERVNTRRVSARSKKASREEGGAAGHCSFARLFGSLFGARTCKFNLQFRH
jgi:hypothetical protein